MLARGAALALLLVVACLVFVCVVVRDLQAAAAACGWRAAVPVLGVPVPGGSLRVGTQTSPRTSGKAASGATEDVLSLRERALGARLPLRLPTEVTAYIDSIQFPSQCDQDTPATVWTAWSWGGPGLGAHFIHWSWTLGASLAMRRTYVARDPDMNFGYNEGRCIHSLFCALHPISSCTEAEVDGKSLAAQEARGSGWVYGHYGRKRSVNLSAVLDVRRDLGRIFNSEDYWTDQLYGDPTVSCRATMWVPAQFRTIGGDREWHSLRDSCNFSAFDSLPGGRARASRDLLWWRSMMVGYFFQPLPHVFKRAQEKVKRVGLPEGGGGPRCLSLHIRRGDKVTEGSPASEGRPHLLAEYMERAAELAEVAGGTMYLASDDLSAVLKEWDVGGYAARWRLLVDREELPWSVGFNIGRPKRDDELEETLAAAWTFSSCPYMVGSLESYFYKLAIHVGVARGIYRDSRNLNGASYAIGVMAVPGKNWYNFMP